MVINNNPDLTNSYSNLESFKSKASKPQQVYVQQEQEPDKVEITSNSSVEKPVEKKEEPVVRPKKKRRGIVQTFKNCIAGAKKFGVGLAEYTVATAKGLVYGTVAALSVLSVDSIIGMVKLAKDAKKSTPNVAEGKAPSISEKILKLPTKKGKIGAAVAGLAVLGYNWFRASLNVSERCAAIDHRWGSGHDEVQ